MTRPHRTSRVPAALLLIAILLTTAGCFPGGGTFHEAERAGFFSGIWHGWIAPLSLILSIFSDGIRIYEPYNTGWWYDFGFYMAVISGFGGLALSRRKKSSDGHSR